MCDSRLPDLGTVTNQIVREILKYLKELKIGATNPVKVVEIDIPDIILRQCRPKISPNQDWVTVKAESDVLNLVPARLHAWENHQLYAPRFEMFFEFYADKSRYLLRIGVSDYVTIGRGIVTQVENDVDTAQASHEVNIKELEDVIADLADDDKCGLYGDICPSCCKVLYGGGH